MEERAEYDVLKLVEHQDRCYISTDCIRGVTLAAYLKYHPSPPKEVLLGWLRQTVRELEKFHRCRGNPCYIYVNPYSIILDDGGGVHLLDTGSSRQEELIKRMERRSVRESFLLPDNQYYLRASEADDIYGIGRLFQYVFSAAEPVPAVSGREKRTFRKMIFKCLNQNPGQESETRFKKKYHCIHEISEQFPTQQDKSNKKRKILVSAAVTVCSCTALSVLVRAAFQEKEPPEKETGRQEEEQRADGDEVKAQVAELQENMGMLYFTELEEYEKSRRIFAELKEINPVYGNYERLAGYLSGEEDEEWEEISLVLQEIEAHMPDRQDYRYYLLLIRGYALAGEPEADAEVIRLGNSCMELESWEKECGEEQEKELRWELADAYENTGEFDKAAGQYEGLLETEQDEQMREQIYLKETELFLREEKPEEAWDACQRGIQELDLSARLRIQFIRMQCSTPAIDREVCARTIQKYIEEIPQLVSQPEFQKLQQEYGIRVEGGKVWVGR